MSKQNSNETKERKSLKERVADNKGKILAGAGLVAIGVLTYCGYKECENIKELCEILKYQGELNKAQGKLNNTIVNVTEKEIDHMLLTRRIAEEGALEEAIKSVNKKIDYRVKKLEGCVKEASEVALAAKEKYELELKILYKDRDRFQELWDKRIE